jgi:hypothetical protein
VRNHHKDDGQTPEIVYGMSKLHAPALANSATARLPHIPLEKCVTHTRLWGPDCDTMLKYARYSAWYTSTGRNRKIHLPRMWLASELNRCAILALRREYARPDAQSPLGQLFSKIQGWFFNAIPRKDGDDPCQSTGRSGKRQSGYARQTGYKNLLNEKCIDVYSIRAVWYFIGLSDGSTRNKGYVENNVWKRQTVCHGEGVRRPQGNCSQNY